MVESRFFLDTNGWVALLNASDGLHGASRAWWNRLILGGVAVVTTDWVIAETGNGLAKSLARVAFCEAVERLQGTPQTLVIEIDRQRRVAALEFYRQRPDKDWGLVDCASFQVMNELAIRQALTNDRHFTQAGFEALLRS
ncbi:MAG TPA: PIN domain-containing protein [Thermoanaerobaculia bacterium]|nr:PIN domain-containing protein [Thermoanaerobaculia bacterium]